MQGSEHTRRWQAFTEPPDQGHARPAASLADRTHITPPSALALPGVLNQVVDEAPVGYVQADRSGRMARFNRRWCAMLQYTEAEMLQRSIQDVTHPEDLPKTLEAVQRMAQGGPNFSIDKRYLRKDGSTLWATSSVTALRGPDGQYLGLVAIVLDVSERHEHELELQRLAQSLVEADRRKSEFLATLAHELRNPMAPLSHALQMLRLEPGNVATVERAREMMERQVRHLVRLVDELMDVARIARGKIALRLGTVDLKDVVQGALDLSGPLIRQQHHQVSVHLPDQPVYLHADATRLTQVLTNLLNNAAKYTPPGGRIRIDAWTRDKTLALSVRDNGVGIPAEDLPHIFDLFTQVGRSLDMAQGGLGIGLSLTRQLVELHGGKVTVTSEGLGRGSVFTVELPTCEPPDFPCVGLPAQAAQESPAQAPLSILVVDDNADGANALADVLKLSGHHAEVAYDGRSALEMARRLQPQAAFLDLSMPGMDGFELARQLKQHYPAMVLVAMTGWGSATDRQRTQAAGFEEHLIKPADIPAIDAALERIAARQQDRSLPGRPASISPDPREQG